MKFLREAIVTGKPSKSQQVSIPDTLQVQGLPDFSESQRQAIKMANFERLSIIQGPPGCGKTMVVAAVAANWMKDIANQPKVLICAPSNTAADFIAERLHQVPML